MRNYFYRNDEPERGTILTNYYLLRDGLAQLAKEAGDLQSLQALYSLGKMSMSSREKRDLDELANASGPLIDPFASIRTHFSDWNLNADLYVQQFVKSNALVKSFNAERMQARRALEKQRPEIPRLQARVNRLASLLDTINTNQLSLLPKKKSPTLKKELKASINPYEILQDLENQLRTTIQAELEKLDRNWWKSRIPEDVRENAEERKSKNKKVGSWLYIGTMHPIHYVDFTDYAKIISRKDNWEQAFKAVFREKEITAAKLRELEPIRNDIAHSRELSIKQKERLRLNAADLVICIGSK